MREMKGQLALTGMPPCRLLPAGAARMCELREVYPKQHRNAS